MREYANFTKKRYGGFINNFAFLKLSTYLNRDEFYIVGTIYDNFGLGSSGINCHIFLLTN